MAGPHLTNPPPPRPLLSGLPYDGGGFLKKLGASFSPEPPPPPGGGRSLVGLLCPMSLYIPGAEGARKLFSLYFPSCGLGGLVGGCLLRLNPPPPHRGRPRAMPLAKKWVGALLI